MGWNNAKWDAAISADQRGRQRRQPHHHQPRQHAGRRSGRLAHPERADRRQLPERRVLLQLVHQPGELGPVQHPGLEPTGRAASTPKVTPIRNAQNKVTGFKVSAAPTADGYVYYTRHTTYPNPEYAGATYRVPRHLALARQRRWQRRLGREGQRQGRHGHPVRGPRRLIQPRTNALDRGGLRASSALVGLVVLRPGQQREVEERRPQGSFARRSSVRVKRVRLEADCLGSARREHVERRVGRWRSAARLRLDRVGPTRPN